MREYKLSYNILRVLKTDCLVHVRHFHVFSLSVGSGFMQGLHTSSATTSNRSHIRSTTPCHCYCHHRLVKVD